MKKLLYVCFLAFVVACKDDADLILNDCKAENVTQDLSWLKDLIASTKEQQVTNPAEIHSYTYKGLTVYAVDLCVTCSDYITKVYNCQGDVICEFGGIGGVNTCQDFEGHSSEKRLIWRSPKQ